MSKHGYRVGKSQISLHLGDLATSTAEVLVSSDDVRLTMGGGVSEAINRASGGRLREEITKLIPARVGDVVVSSAAAHPTAKYILHGVTVDYQQYSLPRFAVVRQIVERAMQFLGLLRCRSIAFPAVGAGVAGLKYEQVAFEMASTLVRALLDADAEYHVELWLLDRFDTRNPGELLSLFQSHIAADLSLEVAQEGGSTALEAPGTESMPASEPERDVVQRRQSNFNMLQLLDRRRHVLETELIAQLSGGPSETGLDIAALRRDLDEIETLRKLYEGALNPGLPETREIPGTVFLSSTYRDLKSHRLALIGLIERLQLRFVGMERFVPAGQRPSDFIRREVEKSQIYLGVFGLRYGSIEPTTGASMTELEYRQAVNSNKQRLIFVMDDRARVTADMVEQDPDSLRKLKELRATLGSENVYGSFKSIPDLVKKVEHALGGVLASGSQRR